MNQTNNDALALTALGRNRYAARRVEMIMKIGRAAVIVGGSFLVGAGIYFVSRVLTLGWGGSIITINPPLGYALKVRDYGPQDTQWRLEETGANVTVKSELKVWAQSPLVPMNWGYNTKTLLGGYKSRASEDKRKNPKSMIVSGVQKVTMHGTQFVGFQTQEVRPNAFVVIHYVAFDVRGRHYNGSAVFRFADKRASPANLKIAEAEWRKILASIQ